MEVNRKARETFEANLEEEGLEVEHDFRVSDNGLIKRYIKEKKLKYQRKQKKIFFFKYQRIRLKRYCNYSYEYQ